MTTKIEAISSDKALDTIIGLIDKKRNNSEIKKLMPLPETIYKYDGRDIGIPILQYSSSTLFESATLLDSIANQTQVKLPKQIEIAIYLQETASWLNLTYINTEKRIIIKIRKSTFSEEEEELTNFIKWLNHAEAIAKSEKNKLISIDNGFIQSYEIQQ